MKDRQQNCQYDDSNNAAHCHDDEWFEKRQCGAGEIIEFAFEIFCRAFEHYIQLPGALTACGQIYQQRRKNAARAHGTRQTAAAPHRFHDVVIGGGEHCIANGAARQAQALQQRQAARDHRC